MTTKLSTVDIQFSRDNAVKRSVTASFWRYAQRVLRTVIGSPRAPNRVCRLYYPNYIAHTTITIPRRFASDRVEKILSGVDAMTTHTGVIDVELPDQTTRRVDDNHVLIPEMNRDDVHAEWREWIFEYASREYRPVARPDFALDSLDLLYIPYWIVEFNDETFAVNGLTKAADPIDTHHALAEHYRMSNPDP